MAQYVRLLSSEARTNNATSNIISNDEGDAEALHLVVDVTSGSNLSVSIKGNDTVSGKSYTLLTSIVPSGTTVMKIGPDYAAAANVAKDYLPYEWFVDYTPSGSTTFSVGASMI